MSTINLGGLSIGATPRVVGTLSSFESVLRFKNLAEKPCDLAEVRLDEIGENNEWTTECQQIEHLGTPIIFTLRGAAEGGKCYRSESERISIIKKALPLVSIVDLEIRSKLAEKLIETARSFNKPLLLSYHDFQKTPTFSELREVIAEASETAAIIKISTMINQEQDVTTLQGLLGVDCNIPICVIGMGPLGTKTRTGFPGLGSCLTYGYVDKANAPGQLPASVLVDHLRKTIPKYNQEFIMKHPVPEFV